MSTYPIRTVEAPSYYRVETVEVFDCECANTIRADTWTECQQCGAKYERDDEQMVQTTPPHNSVVQTR